MTTATDQIKAADQPRRAERTGANAWERAVVQSAQPVLGSSGSALVADSQSIVARSWIESKRQCSRTGNPTSDTSVASSRRRGFSLIELMITVAIIGILAAIAYPSYQQQVRRSNRAEVQSFLVDLAQRQARYLMDARQYALVLAELNATLPDRVAQFYDIEQPFVVDTRPPRFAITATPKAGTMQVQDLDGAALTINQAGAKTPPGAW